jgi:SET domain-containing protein
MTFHDGLIIDATRGSICRFVNHSCSPNCRVEKWIVDGEPRMALFAGDEGIETGEELTYDYNFEYVVAVYSQSSLT